MGFGKRQNHSRVGSTDKREDSAEERTNHFSQLYGRLGSTLSGEDERLNESRIALCLPFSLYLPGSVSRCNYIPSTEGIATHSLSVLRWFIYTSTQLFMKLLCLKILGAALVDFFFVDAIAG